MTDRIILTDCDGVLCMWLEAFYEWMEARGYKMHENPPVTYHLHLMYNGMEAHDAKKLATIFNESAAIGFLTAYDESVYYVNKLHKEHGYRFRVITSLSSDKYAGMLREMNLRNLFGDAIESVICLETGAPKGDALEQYRDSGLWWIEDHTNNADLGHALGLKTILLEHGHNSEHLCPYPIAKDWKEIYELITARD